MISITLLLLSGCGEDTALSVGDVSFRSSDLLGLSDAQEELLSLITVVGLSTARGEVAQVGAPEIGRRRDELRIDQLQREMALEAAGVTDGVLAARYRQDPDFELTVRHLVVLSERWQSLTQRADAQSRAEAALDRARAGEPFPELAGEVSDEPAAEARGGLLEPGREGSWVDEFWQAANGLEVSEISDVVESEYGFHVLRLDAREAVAFAEARSSVVAEVAAELGSFTGETTEGRESSVRPALLAEAERRGLALDPVEAARLEREWEFQLAGWAGAFGFEPGLPPAEIRDVALLALGRTDQAARIARDEIPRYREALLGAYSIETTDPGKP